MPESVGVLLDDERDHAVTHMDVYLCLCGNVAEQRNATTAEVKEPPSLCCRSIVAPVGRASEHVSTYH